MKVILFGATGMIGQGALSACLADPAVKSVTSVVRTASGVSDPKLREVMHRDFLDYTAIENELMGHDACFFCLGVSSARMNEPDYFRVTHDMTVVAAQALLRHNDALTFLYISGASTDSSEQGSVMWARVKGKTENDLLAMEFKAAYMLRPGYIQPVDGARSKTTVYRAAYAVLGPLFPVWKSLFPRQVLTTTELGRAMIAVAQSGAPQRILEAPDLVALGRPS